MSSVPQSNTINITKPVSAKISKQIPYKEKWQQENI